MTSTCPDGFSQVGTNCYRNCASGFTANGTSCFPNCVSGTDTGAVCEKIITPRVLVGPATCPKGTTYAQSQTGLKWPAPNNSRLLEFCFDTCPKPDLQKYAADDSGACIPKECGRDDQTGNQFPQAGIIDDLPICSRSAYVIPRSFDFGQCSSGKQIAFPNTSGNPTLYTSVNAALAPFGLDIGSVNPNSVYSGINFAEYWESLFQCQNPCPAGYVRYDFLTTDLPPSYSDVYKSDFYCFKPDFSAPPIFVDPQTDIPNTCSNVSGGEVFGQSTIVPDKVDSFGLGYNQEFTPTAVRVTDSLGIYDKNVTYNIGDIVATFQNIETKRFMGPFFKILDPTKSILGLPPHSPSNLYYADPNTVLSNDFATTKDIGTSYSYLNLRPAGESNFYSNLCTLDSLTGESLYCPPLCATGCAKGNDQNFGLQEPYFVTNPPQLWQNDFSYVVGNVISFSGIFYKCVADHTSSSANQPPNISYWQTFPNWTILVLYNKGDVVNVSSNVGQRLYTCLITHTSSPNIFPPTSSTYWEDYGFNISSSVCYPRCGSSVLYNGNGPLCYAEPYNSSSIKPVLAYSSCENNSVPIPLDPGYQNTNQCYSLCPLYNTLQIPDVYPSNDPTDPLWATAFLNCIAECPINESFQDNGSNCSKIPYTRVQEGSYFTSLQSSVSTNLENNSPTVSKVSMYGGTQLLLVILVVVAVVSFFIVYVLWYQRIALEKVK